MADERRSPRSDDDDTNENKTKKQCIPPSPSTSQGIAASPPRFVSLEELMKAAKGMTNMSLAHEITVNSDFRLEKKDPVPNSLEKAVKETMHRAFWELLSEQLQQSPPVYTLAFTLLDEVKSSLQDLLLPQHTRLQAQINQVLDVDLIKQQAEQETLNFQEYAQFVTSVMGKMCAPVRDEKIVELTKTTDVIPLFRGILETLDLMKVDMANFTINMMRPYIVANSVTYEKEKFAEFLKHNPDGLDKTKKWLERHLDAAEKIESSDLKQKIDSVINKSYLELTSWNPKEPLPETLTMDEERIKNATNQLQTLTKAGAVLLLTFSRAGQHLCSVSEWKQSVKRHVLTLLGKADSAELRTLAVKLTADIASGLEKYSLSGQSVSGLEDEIQRVSESDHKIVGLLNTRIREFLLQAITSRTADRQQIPPGLSILQEELTQLTGNFLRMVSHNRAVFDEFYVRILQESLAGTP